MSVLTHERWSKAWEVLSGEKPELGVSDAAAARAAEVSVQVLRGWIRRSRRKDVEDEPWVWNIAEQYDSRGLLQAGVLEDVAFGHAVCGTEEPVFSKGEIIGHKKKFDHSLLLRLLEKRDPSYRPKSEVLKLNAEVDLDNLYERFKAQERLKELESEKKQLEVFDI